MRRPLRTARCLQREGGIPEPAAARSEKRFCARSLTGVNLASNLICPTHLRASFRRGDIARAHSHVTKRKAWRPPVPEKRDPCASPRRSRLPFCPAKDGSQGEPEET